MNHLIIGTRGGIGDTLFLTPILRRLKEKFDKAHLVVNTAYPDLLKNNPFVDEVGVTRYIGRYWTYPDPIHCKEPTAHHIISVWRNMCADLDIETPEPELKPELYIDLPKNKRGVGVQVMHKYQWHGKKVWPHFDDLADLYEPIDKQDSIEKLVQTIAGYKLVVCAEGGISHIAKAVGTQAIVLFGGWCNPEWNGYKDQINVVNKVDCSYCYNSYECKENYKCWQISLETVQSLISEAVENYQKPTSTSMRSK